MGDGLCLQDACVEAQEVRTSPLGAGELSTLQPPPHTVVPQVLRELGIVPGPSPLLPLSP